jgi:DNA-binding transcriptional MerR regulator
MIGSYPLMIYRQRRLGLLTLEEVAGRCGLHPEFVQRLVVLGLIDPEDDCTDLFCPEVTLRIERLLRLRRDLGVNYSAAALVLDLLERIDSLEGRLRRLGRE